jgi:hypothetical protein
MQLAFPRGNHFERLTSSRFLDGGPNASDALCSGFERSVKSIDVRGTDSLLASRYIQIYDIARADTIAMPDCSLPYDVQQHVSLDRLLSGNAYLYEHFDIVFADPEIRLRCDNNLTLLMGNSVVWQHLEAPLSIEFEVGLKGADITLNFCPR